MSPKKSKRTFIKKVVATGYLKPMPVQLQAVAVLVLVFGLIVGQYLFPLTLAFPRAEALTPDPELPLTGSISVCKIIIDNQDNVTDGSADPGKTFSISGIIPAQTSEAAPTGVFGTATFTTPLSLNSRILSSSSSNDAQCVTFPDLLIGSYYYGEEVFPSVGWMSQKYNDQFTTPVVSLVDFFPYNGNLFDGDLGNDEGRNKNADGHIVLLNDRPDRTLVLLNQTVAPPTTPIATLVVIKHVVNGDNGTKTASDFTVNVTAGHATPASFAGAEAPGVNVVVDAGDYSIDETTVSNYNKALSADCSGTIAADTTKTCIITNIFQSSGGGGSGTPIADLGVSKGADKSSANVGDTVTFTITASNNGPDQATNAVVHDTLPAGFTLSTSIPSVGSYATSTDDWTIGTLANGGSATLLLSGTINEGTAGQTITNQVSVSGSQTDNNSANNNASAQVAVNTPSGGGTGDGSTSGSGGGSSGGGGGGGSTGGGGGGGGSAGSTVSGIVYNDLNGNGTKDSGEPGLSGWTVYLDANNNATFDIGESSTVSDPNGFYQFTSLSNTSHNVREVVQPNWAQTEPGAANGYKYALSLSNSMVTGKNFGNAQGQVLGEVTPVAPSGDVGQGEQEPEILGEQTKLPRTGVPAWALLLPVLLVGVLLRRSEGLRES